MICYALIKGVTKVSVTPFDPFVTLAERLLQVKV